MSCRSDVTVVRRAVTCISSGVLSGVLSCVAAGAASTVLRAQPVLPRADLRWSVLTLAGDTRTLESLRGRVIVINSWATWCEPCVAELGSLAALRRAIPDTSLAFALIAAQRREPVADFVRRRRLTLPVYLEATRAPEVYRFNAVPTTWIVDRAGRIALRRRGAARWDTPEMLALVRTLLADSSAVTR